MDRRNFIKSGVIVCAAPAIVKAENIMRIAAPCQTLQAVSEEFQYYEFQELLLRDIARSLDVPYKLLVADYTNTSRLQ